MSEDYVDVSYIEFNQTALKLPDRRFNYFYISKKEKLKFGKKKIANKFIGIDRFEFLYLKDDKYYFNLYYAVEAPLTDNPIDKDYIEKYTQNNPMEITIDWIWMIPKNAYFNSSAVINNEYDRNDKYYIDAANAWRETKLGIKNLDKHIFFIKKIGTKINNIAKYKEAIKLFVWVELIDFVNNKMTAPYVGWGSCPEKAYLNVSDGNLRKNNFIYAGIETKSLAKDKLLDKLFDGVLSDDNEYFRIETSKNWPNSMGVASLSTYGLCVKEYLHMVYELMYDNPMLLYCFEYNLLAFGMPFIKGILNGCEYKTDLDYMHQNNKIKPFVLEICGENRKLNINAPFIANIFCNMFSVPYNNIYSLDKDYMIMYDKEKYKLANYRKFRNFPLLVSNKEYSVKNNQRINAILEAARDDDFYPVLVTRKKLDIECLLAANISEIRNLSTENEYIVKLKKR